MKVPVVGAVVRVMLIAVMLLGMMMMEKVVIMG